MIGAAPGARAQAAFNTNGSFEATEPGVITDLTDGIEGWVLEVGTTVETAPTFEVVEGSAYDGDRALKVAVNGLGSNAWDIQAVASEIPAVPGRTYEFSVWARSDPSGGTASFTVGNSDYSEYGRLGSESVALTEEWAEYTFEFTVNDEEAVIRAPIHFNFAVNEGGAVYIDALKVYDPEAGMRAVVLEAEAGTLGDGVATGTDEDAGISFITPAADLAGDYPDEGRVASYQVAFPDSGWYDLYARVYVGAETYEDDSFFYADSFGVKSPTDPEAWILANQLASAGFAEPDEFVMGLGAVQSEVWKWVLLSENDLGEAPDSFYVAPDDLTLTFQIGMRESGLRIAQLAFGRSDLYYTVEALSTGGAGVAELPVEQPPLGPPLAASSAKFLGNVYSPSQVEDFEYYWNYVIPENAGKWGAVEGTRDVMNWGGLDAAYELAQENGLPFNFHVLVWGNQQPAWMVDLEPAEQLEEIQEWFDAVAERYPDMDVVQVVNEPLHDPPDDAEDGAYIEALGGAGTTGWDWVITSFEMARETFPDARLMLNDYNILSSYQNAQEYRGIIDLLQERDLIDVIGVQGHAFSTRPGAPIKQVLDLLGETGLPIQVTEMDVDGNPTSDPNLSEAASDQNQLEAFQRIFPVVWEHPSVEGVTMWGWKPGLWRTEQEAHLVRSNGEERPALQWLREFIAMGTDVEDGAAAGVELVGNAPNPFGASTEIVYTLAEPAPVRLAVYDALGRHVATLVDQDQPAGEYRVPFQARGLASGVYLYRLQAGAQVSVKQMVISR